MLDINKKKEVEINCNSSICKLQLNKKIGKDFHCIQCFKINVPCKNRLSFFFFLIY